MKHISLISLSLFLCLSACKSKQSSKVQVSLCGDEVSIVGTETEEFDFSSEVSADVPAVEVPNPVPDIDSTVLKDMGAYKTQALRNSSGQSLYLIFSKRTHDIGYSCNVELCTISDKKLKRLTAFKGKDGMSKILTARFDTTRVSDYMDGWEPFDPEYDEAFGYLRMPFTKNGITYGDVDYKFNGEFFEQTFPYPEWQLDYYAEKQYFDVDFDGKKRIACQRFFQSTTRQQLYSLQGWKKAYWISVGRLD